MENKNITQKDWTEDWTTFEDYERDRKREEVRAFVKQFSELRTKRLESEIVLSTCFGPTRPNLYDTPEDYFLRGNKNNRKETRQDTIIDTYQTQKTGF